MIGTSLHEYLFIRTSIFLLCYAPLLEVVGLVIVLFSGNAWSSTSVRVLACLFAVELLFALALYLLYRHRLTSQVKYPPPLSATDRQRLFHRCLSHVPDPEHYLREWFLGAELSEIRRDNVKEFLLWAFFDRGDLSHSDVLHGDVADEVNGYVDELETLLGSRLEPGRGSAKCLRLTIDAIKTQYRSVLWYFIVGFVDCLTHCHLAWNGFQYHAQPLGKLLSIFPPKVQVPIFARHQSPVDELGYWHRPHTAKDKLPVLFLHGIGIGLWTYSTFLAEINETSRRGEQIGVIAIEILPISFRLGPPPVGKTAFVEQLTRILDHHGWTDFVLVSHSYGSVISTHILHSPLATRIPAMVLMDPVSVLLHLPDVAYNFTRRRPRRANEWQLWYFASMDPGVAECLGRYFFWAENIVWRDELLGLGMDKATEGGGNGIDPRYRKRKVTVCLSGRDQITDTATVARYLKGENLGPLGDSSGSEIGHDTRAAGDQLTKADINVVLFPRADHAQLFDARVDRERVLQVLRSYCES